MPYTDYDDERDGNLLVKASALQAALSRYHSKYLTDRVAVMHYKGSVTAATDLANVPTPAVGDVYNVSATGENFAWDGTSWDNLGSVVSLTGYATEQYVGQQIAAQHDFGNVKVGSTTIGAATASDTFEIEAGSNITLTVSAASNKVTVSAADTTYSNATTAAAGLMSAEDYTLLHGLPTDAEKNTIEAVQVNGTTLSVSNEAVNITVTEGAATGAISVNGSSVSVHGLGSAAYLGTVTQVASNGTNVPIESAVYSLVSDALGNALVDAQAQDMVDDIWNPPAV